MIFFPICFDPHDHDLGSQGPTSPESLKREIVIGRMVMIVEIGLRTVRALRDPVSSPDGSVDGVIGGQ